MDIRIILFDLGNVIIPVSPERTGEAWSRSSGIPAADIMKKLDFNRGIFNDFEKGTVPPGKFRKAVLKITGLKLSAADFDRGWNAMVVGVYPGVEEIIDRLGKSYRMGILSNTNRIHERYCRKNFPGVFSRFNKVFLSHRMGLRKPEEAIFKKVLGYFRVQPDEMVFLDDRPEMTEAASKLGILTVTVRNPCDIPVYLKNFGVLI